MPVITLTTDMGIRDYYVAAIKGAVLCQIPDARIVDVSHFIKPWDILQASFVVKNAYSCFPAGSVHIIGVDTELTPSKPHVAIKYDGHYFIGSDNGVFSLIFDRKPDKIVELNLAPDSDLLTFPTKDIFVKAACHLIRGGTLEVIGREKEGLRVANIGIPANDEHTIVGKVIYVDNYENIICNITSKLFKDVSKGRSFKIYKGGTSYDVPGVSSGYHESETGDLLVLFNSLGLLEIAINKGNASSLLNLKAGDQIRINFEENLF